MKTTSLVALLIASVQFLVAANVALAQNAYIEPGSQARIDTAAGNSKITTEGVVLGEGKMALSTFSVSYETKFNGEPAQVQYTITVPNDGTKMGYFKDGSLYLPKDIKLEGQIQHGKDGDKKTTRLSGILRAKSSNLTDSWFFATESPLPPTPEAKVKEILSEVDSNSIPSGMVPRLIFKVEKVGYTLTPLGPEHQ